MRTVPLGERPKQRPMFQNRVLSSSPRALQGSEVVGGSLVGPSQGPGGARAGKAGRGRRGRAGVLTRGDRGRVEKPGTGGWPVGSPGCRGSEAGTNSGAGRTVGREERVEASRIEGRASADSLAGSLGTDRGETRLIPVSEPAIGARYEFQHPTMEEDLWARVAGGLTAARSRGGSTSVQG